MPADLPGSEELWTEPPAHHTGPIGRAAPTAPAGPGRQRMSSRRPFVLGGVAAVALLGGASMALAATTNTESPSAAPRATTATRPPLSQAAGSGQGTGRFGGFGPGFRHFARPGLGGGLFGALHGQIVVAKPGGGYQTEDIQTGRVTTVSATSVTLRSADGFTKTYVITGSTIVDAQRAGIGSVHTGNEASLLATVSGSTATAASLEDLTLLRQQRRARGFAGQGASAWPGEQTG
jgi:hypothetical protein